MAAKISTEDLDSLLLFVGAEAAFVATFALILTRTSARALTLRVVCLLVLGTMTHYMERSIVQTCHASGRPHWAAICASLLWIQLLSASELIMASRVDGSQLLPRSKFLSAIGLLWNTRRVNTKWQVKNVPSGAREQGQSRAGFILRRLGVTLAAYLFIDVAVSMEPPDPALVQTEKATLISLHKLSIDDLIFRSVTAVSYWITSATINTFMVNICAIFAVLLRLSGPADCPPVHGSFLDAFTVRHFWGSSWHQMFRSFLTGHADIIVDNALPFLPRHSLASRYLRLTLAFFISGLIHYRADQAMGVCDTENGTIVFFLLQALAIMMEDTVAPVISAILPKPIRRVLGWIWVLGFLIWTTPIWTYPSARLGLDSAALVPATFIGSYMSH